MSNIKLQKTSQEIFDKMSEAEIEATIKMNLATISKDDIDSEQAKNKLEIPNISMEGLPEEEMNLLVKKHLPYFYMYCNNSPKGWRTMISISTYPDMRF